MLEYGSIILNECQNVKIIIKNLQVKKLLNNFCNVVLYTSGPVSLKERLLYTLDKLFVKQVKSFLLLLDLDPFILLSSPHNKAHQVHKSIRYFHISHTDSL